MIEIELSRFILVISLVVVIIEYYRTHRVTGGSLTPGYLAILIMGHEWSLLISVGVFTLITFLIMRLFVMRWFLLTKPWVYGTGVLVSVVAHSVFNITDSIVTLPNAFGLVLVAGLFVTPGLIAYDLTAQGIRKTTTEIAIITAVVCAICLPFALTDALPDTPVGNFTGRIEPDWWWIAVAAAVISVLALRMARGLATAGYIGAVFLVEVAFWDSLLLLLLCVVAARLIAFVSLQRFILTPRQKFQFSFLIGAIVTWTVIYWGNEWGWDAASRLDAFTLEPLVIAGLLVSDLGRTNIRRTVVGVGAAVAFVVVQLLAVSVNPWVGAATAVVLFGIVLLLARDALTKLFASVGLAVDEGKLWRPNPSPASPS